jgi:hypothetical protein
MKTTIFNSMALRAKKFFAITIKDMDKVRKKILPRISLGILLSKSLKLSEIIRKIKKDNEKMKTLENKLSLNLSSKQWNEIDMLKTYLKEVVKPYIKEDTPIYIDRIDYAKQEAQKMEGLDYVWDSSDKQTVKGYWGFDSLAKISQEELVPLVNFIYSLKLLEDKEGIRSENEAMEAGFDILYEIFGNNGEWIQDRGFDRYRFYRYYNKRRIKHTTRIKGDRTLFSRGGVELGSARSVARNVELNNIMEVEKKINKRRKKRYYIKFGYKEVYLYSIKRPYYLIVAQIEGKRIKEDNKFIMLLTNVPIKHWMDAEVRIRRYLDRWDIEDTTRFMKQEMDLEGFMVRGFIAINRLIVLAYIMMGLLTFIMMTSSENIIKRIIEFSESFVKEVEFVYYRIIRGVRKILLEYPDIQRIFEEV